MSSRIKLIPYGISDFKQLRRENKYFVDKSMFLPLMEDQGNFLFFIRPRRFGKSIFLSMMRAYYDINERDNFDTLFDGLWIKDNPTPERGKFQVLHMDFSRVQGDAKSLEKDFSGYCDLMLDDFMDRYSCYYDEGYAANGHSKASFRLKFSYIDNMAKMKGYPLYLIIDEYDNFTNTVLNEKGEGVYHALTHASGFYRDVFKLFKGMFSRILMMGVSPVTMDDVTSGYNIASNITMNPLFNLMLGFSEDDVRQMIRYYQEAGVLKADEEDLVAEMKPWYDNYCFAKASVYKDPKLFNCDMVSYFLRNVIQTGYSPDEMIDVNTRTDYTKMNKLLQLDKLDGNRRGILNEIAENGFIYENPVESFPAKDMANAENFVSLLFYYGMLTIGDVEGADIKLTIPNNNVRRQYYDYLFRQYQEIAYIDTRNLSRAYTEAALRGNWQPMVKEITDAYEKTTSVRQLIEGERNLQGFMTAYLALNPYYLTAPEMELNHGYCDFFLMPDLRRYPMVEHSYILELKYLKQGDNESVAQEQWEKAVEQIRLYAKAPMVETLVKSTILLLLVVQIQGHMMVKTEEITN